MSGEGQVEVLPGFGIDRQVVSDIEDSRREVDDLGRQLLAVLRRAHAATSAGYEAARAHAATTTVLEARAARGHVSDEDEIWKWVPGLEALGDAVYAVHELTGQFENVAPQWPTAFKGPLVDG